MNKRKFTLIAAMLTLCVVATATAWGQAKPQGLIVVVVDPFGAPLDPYGYAPSADDLLEATRDGAIVHFLSKDQEQVDSLREWLRSKNVYGQASAAKFDGETLPYVDNLANQIIVIEPFDLSEEELLRAMSPGGTATIVPGNTDFSDRLITKPRPDNIDEWTHYLHNTSNNAVGADEVADQPRSIQWQAEPRFGRSHEEMASMSTTVTSGGRVFFIADEAPFASIRYRGQWTLTARDAFNGIELWKRDISNWTDHLRHFRSGPVHLQRRLVAVDNHVFVTLGLEAPIKALDAATGAEVRTFAGSEYAEEIMVNDGVLYTVVGTSEVDRTGGGLYLRGEPKATDFRFIAAYNVESGEQLWKHVCPDSEFLLPLTLAIRDGSVFYQSTYGMVRLDAASGETAWRTERSTPKLRMSFSAPTLVVDENVVLCADREAQPDKPETGVAEDGEIEWGVHGWNEPGYPRKGPSVLRAYSIESGEELWNAPCTEQYNSPTDVFVVDGIVWIGSDFKGYDVETGELIQSLTWKGNPVSMPHHRCYRNKATEQFIFTGRSGVEIVSFEHGWVGNNSWIRGTCQYGVMPANGFVYAPPDACACNNKVKMNGFFAAHPGRDLTPIPDDQRLTQGPAFGQVNVADAGPNDWAMYRADNARGGATAASVPTELATAWTIDIGGTLTQPICVGSQVYVASVDTHTVHAINASDGEAVWTFTANGRIDSAPTYYQGMILFGSSDGCVYALRAADGELAWRFEAATSRALVTVFEQLESVWPVNGTVLIQNGVLYVAAGRNTYLDGGMTLYCLNPTTGEMISKNSLYNIDPETNAQTGVEGSRGFDMEGVRQDILVGDGESVFMKHFRFDAEGNLMAENSPHLLSIHGLLGEEWFVRSYWLVGTTTGAGWGGWANAAKTAPSGRILSFNETGVYGYGRESIASAAVGHRLDNYLLWRQDVQPDSTSVEPTWIDENALTVRAMVLAGDQLVVAGPPDIGLKTDGEEILAFENEPEALAAFRGERGVFLRVHDAASGELNCELELPAIPVFDGISAAGGRVFVALRDGSLVCLGE
jgi:outer membrane protein assembly factor BamB